MIQNFKNIFCAFFFPTIIKNTQKMCSKKEFDVLSPTHVSVETRADCRGDCQIKVTKTPLCEKKKKTKKVKALDVTLTYGTSIPANEYNNFPSISSTGSQVYIVFQNFYNGNPLRAQLFDNVNGQLIGGPTIGFDAAFPDIWEGHASSDFSLFSLLESDNDGNMRIRILDNKFNVSTFRNITDPIFDAPYGALYGGYFSEDSRYVLFYYSGAEPEGSPPTFPGPFFSKILILDVKNSLSTVAFATIAGVQLVQPGPKLFTLTDRKGKKHLYFVFQICQINANSGVLEPPYFSQVYEADTTTGIVSLIDSQPLPLYADGADVLVRANGREAVISYGGFCSLFPNQTPRIYDIISPQITSTLPNDNSEAHVFIFNGHKQRLLIKQSLNCCNATIAYPPGDGLSYFLGQNVDVYLTPGDPTTQGPYQQDFWCLANIEKGPSGLVFRPQNLPRQDTPTGPNVIFSQDGKWLIRTGVYGYNVAPDYNPLPDALGIHNILLFKVTSAEYKEICKIK